MLFGVPPVLFGGAILGGGASDGGGALSLAVLGPLRTRSSRAGSPVLSNRSRSRRFRLRLVLLAEFPTPVQHAGADGLRVMGGVDDFFGMFFEGLDPACRHRRTPCLESWPMPSSVLVIMELISARSSSRA